MGSTAGCHTPTTHIHAPTRPSHDDRRHPIVGTRAAHPQLRHPLRYIAQAVLFRMGNYHDTNRHVQKQWKNARSTNDLGHW